MPMSAHAKTVTDVNRRMGTSCQVGSVRGGNTSRTWLPWRGSFLPRPPIRKLPKRLTVREELGETGTIPPCSRPCSPPRFPLLADALKGAGPHGGTRQRRSSTGGHPKRRRGELQPSHGAGRGRDGAHPPGPSRAPEPARVPTPRACIRLTGGQPPR